MLTFVQTVKFLYHKRGRTINYSRQAIHYREVR
jgi:hypothetical protein